MKYIIELINTVNSFLDSKIDATFLLAVSSLIMSLLIPIAIMLIDLNKSGSSAENRWAKLVVKKRIIHFSEILKVLISIIIIAILREIVPDLRILWLTLFTICIFYLIYLIKLYIVWIQSDDLTNKKIIISQKELLTSTDYSLEEQKNFWSVFLDYACSTKNGTLLLDPDNFYKLWKQAEQRYQDQKSYISYGFFNLLCRNFANLHLNSDSPFDEKFYKECIHNYLQNQRLVGWNALVKTQTEYVIKKVNEDKFNQDITYYNFQNSINSVMNEFLETNAPTSNLNYVNTLFLQCLLNNRQIMLNDNNMKFFQITEKNMQNSKFSRQTNSLMTKFLNSLKVQQYSFNLDNKISILFPTSDTIVLGNIDHAVNCMLNSAGMYNDDPYQTALELITHKKRFGMTSPSTPIDKSERTMFGINAIKIYASYYKKTNYKDLILKFSNMLISTLKSESFLKSLNKKENAQSLIATANIYVNILNRFVEEFNK